MWKNYLRIAARNLARYRAYTAINLLGLSVAMTVVVLITLWVQHELSYDRYHANAERTVRFTRYWLNADGTKNLHLGHVAPPFGPLLRNDFPAELQVVARTLSNGQQAVRVNDRLVVLEQTDFAEPEFLKIFDYRFLQGTPTTALAGPNLAVLTQDAARKIFGRTDVLNQTLQLNDTVLLKVSGVVANLPSNTHYHWDMLVSYETLYRFYPRDQQERNFGNNSFGTYAVLAPGVTMADMQARMPDFIDRHMPANFGTQGAGQKVSSGTNLELQHMPDIHLTSHLDSEVEANGDIAYVYIFIAVAALILLLAAINFMNLSTARAARRAREVGVRKVSGAVRGQLVAQFLGESLLLASLSLALAVLFANLSLPWFEQFLGLEMDLTGALFLRTLPWLLLALVVVGLAAGAYPALYLSGFAPIQVLKGTMVKGQGGAGFRRVLVVSQFVVTVFLLVAMGVIMHQMDYVQRVHLGFNKDQLVTFTTPPGLNSLQRETLRQELLRTPGVQAATISSRRPTGRLLDSQGWRAEVNGDMIDGDFRIADIHVDHRFFQTYQIPFAAGRDYDLRRASDTLEAFILNEAAIRAIGYASPQAAVGKRFEYGGGQQREGLIVGVVRDFHFESLHNQIAPMVFLIGTNRFNVATVRLQAGQTQAALAALAKVYQRFDDDTPFSHQFLDEAYAQLYDAEQRIGRLFGFFSGLAIFIACLGLYGLTAFATEQRTREIGIRKVMGASTGSIVVLLARNFLLLVLAGTLIAWPLAYFFQDWWLRQFYYNAGFGYGSYLLAFAVVGVIALLTVGLQSARAAMANPVHALRSE